MNKYLEFFRIHRPITVTVGNYKGGAGKTTNAILMGYSAARMGIKTLVIDKDPQSNATKSLMLTRSANNQETVTTISKTLMYGIEQNSFVDLPIEIVDNLYLLPSFIDFEDFPRYLYQNFSDQKERDFVFKKLLDEIKDDYDLILIDVPPMSKEVTRNAIVASDYVLISLQTQERSLTGAENYVKELIKITDLYSLDLDLVGILQVLHKNDGRVDSYIMESALEIFGATNIFKNVVPQMERIKRFDVNGITDNDMHDKKVLQKYNDVTTEFLERLIELRG